MVERHGALVRGSSRAELQRWAVDLEHGTAEASTAGHRQLKPTAPRVYIKPLADEIATLILNGRDDERLKWDEDRFRVRVLIGNIDELSARARETQEGRRKRFHTELKKQLGESGWHQVVGKVKGTYERRLPD